MHWIALPLPWRDEPAASPANTGAAAAAGTMAAPAAGWWALRFTPRVALADGDTVLLEVSTTERLWGGREALSPPLRGQRCWGLRITVRAADVPQENRCCYYARQMAGSSSLNNAPPPGAAPTVNAPSIASASRREI